jgi:hypothetical protein
VAEEDFLGYEAPATAVALRTVKVWPNIASKLQTENPTICSRGDILKIYVGNTWNMVAHSGEERRLRVFENLVLRRIFGPKKDEVRGEWRKIHTDELNDMYSSPNIVWVIKSRSMRWAGNVVRMGERRDVYRVLVGNPEGTRPLERPRRRWEDNNKMDLQEVG